MATGGQLTWAQLVAVARRVGVKVVEAPSSHRGKLGKMGSVVGVTEHTTGTANSFKPDVDYPDYNVVKEGRAGLENSLSAYGIGRFEAIYVFSEFLSWHAGVWNWRGVTDGNGHFLGIECAGVGDYTEFQRRVYPRLVAAILLEINQTPEWAPRHLDGAVPKGRKVDAQGFEDFYQGKSFRQWVEFFMANPAYININYTEDEMAQKDIDEIQRKLSLLLGVEIMDRDPRERTPGEQVLKGRVGYEVGEITGGPQELDAVLANVFANARAILAGNASAVVAAMSREQLAEFAKLVNDEADRRDRDGDPNTGQVPSGS